MNAVRPKNYIVIKHALRDTNGLIGGVMFRGGYGIVEKDSKLHNQIKKLPLIKGQPELPLIALRDINFIIRTRDVELIYGKDIYREYRRILEETVEKERQVVKEEEIAERVADTSLCKFATKTSDGFCDLKAMAKSPAGYCKKHILHDPEIEAIAKINIPKMMTKQEKRELKERILAKLEA